jgi:hypothetical protein
LAKKIDTTAKSLACWYIEDPATKQLAQKIEMTLEVDEEYEFIVVLKSPLINKQSLYAANVSIICEGLDMKHKVFCFGCMEGLKISCPKEMFNEQHQSKMIKVVMRRKQQAQAIKVLLENKSDMEVLTSFQSVEMEKNLQFYIPKDKVQIDANSKALLEIKAIHKLGSQRAPKNGKQLKPEIIHKLVIGKVKDCELKFSLIFEVTII